MKRTNMPAHILLRGDNICRRCYKVLSAIEKVRAEKGNRECREEGSYSFM